MTTKPDPTAGKSSPISYSAAARQIRAGVIKPVYLLFGEEEYLQERFIRLLRDMWLGSENGELGISRDDGKGMTQGMVVDLACQMGFFSARKLVLIDEPAFVPCTKDGRKGASVNSGEVDDTEAPEESDDADTEANVKAGTGTGKVLPPQPATGGEQPLLSWMTAPGADAACIVLRCRQGKPDRRHKLVAEIAKNGGLVETAALTAHERLSYLQESAQSAGKQISQRLLGQIADRPGGLSAALKEMEKIVAYAGEESVITADILEQLLTPNPEAGVFRLVDAIGWRRRAEALGELRVLLARGEPPFYLLAMILRQYRLAFRAKAYLLSGVNPGQLAQVLGAHTFVAEKSAEISRRYSFAELEQVMELLCETDYAMKDGVAHRQALESLILALSSVRQEDRAPRPLVSGKPGRSGGRA